MLTIETDRLYIRELLPADAAGMFVMDADEEVAKYIGKKPVKTVAETSTVIEFIRQQYLENGIGRWAILEKGTNEFVGWTGYKLMTEMVNGYINHYDFGYRLARKFWGKGLATEAGKAALDYGIANLGFKVNNIFAMTDVENAASRNVLEKLGFRFKGIFNYDATPSWKQAGEPVTWYQLAE